MYTITNSLVNYCSNSRSEANTFCKIRKVSAAIFLTIALGAITFSAIFFTSHLLIPSLATSISIVVLLGGVDVCIQICCKKRNTNTEINLLGNPPPPPERNNAGNNPILQPPPVVQAVQEPQSHQIPFPIDDLEEDSSRSSFDSLEEDSGSSIDSKALQNDEAAIAIIPQGTKNPCPNLYGTIKDFEQDIPASKVFASRDLAFEILKFFSIKEICKLELVCKQWRECIGKDYDLWKRLGAKVGYNCLGYEVIHKKKIHLLKSTQYLRELPWTDEELKLNIEFLLKQKNQNVEERLVDFANAIYLRDKQKIWNNYYIEKKNDDTLLIKNLKNPEICIQIQDPCIKNSFDYFLMNDFLLVVSYSYWKRSLNVWSLKDGSPIVLPEEVVNNFHPSDEKLFTPYIYKNLFVPINRNVHAPFEMFITIHDMAKGTSSKINNSGISHQIIACCNENVAFISRSGSSVNSDYVLKISILDLETMEIFPLTSKKRPSTDRYNRTLALNNEHVVICSNEKLPAGNFSCNLCIYKKTNKPNKKFSKKKSIVIPELLKHLSIVDNFLIGCDSKNQTIILDLSLSKELIWDQRKEYSVAFNLNKLSICPWSIGLLHQSLSTF